MFPAQTAPFRTVDLRHGAWPTTSEFLQQVEHLLLAPLVADGPLTMLEVGCGVGALVGAMAAARPDSFFVGLDPDNELLDKGRTSFQRGTSNLAYVQASPVSTGFRDGHFDLAVCRPLTLPSHELQPVLAELTRVVRPGGTVALVSLDVNWSSLRPASRTFASLLQAARRAPPAARAVLHQGSDLPVLLAALGFEEIDVGVTPLTCPDLRPQDLAALLLTMFARVLPPPTLGSLGEALTAEVANIARFPGLAMLGLFVVTATMGCSPDAGGGR